MVTGALNKGKKSWRTKIFFSLPLMKIEIGVLGALCAYSAGLIGGTGTAGSAIGEIASGVCGASAVLAGASALPAGASALPAGASALSAGASVLLAASAGAG